VKMLANFEYGFLCFNNMPVV